MKGNFADREYFYNSEMKKDEQVAIVGNCLEQLAAIIMKNTYEGPIDYYAMAIGDLSFHVRFDREGYFVRSALKCNETGINNKPWTINKQIIIKNGKEAEKALEFSLKTYDYAIVRTVDRYLEFSKIYDEDYCKEDKSDYSNFSEAGHVFLIVGEDEDNYFYVEQSNEINMKKYTCMKGRRDIGVYPKIKFYEAFKRYLGLFYVEFNEDLVYHIGEYGRQIISKSADNFYANYASRVPENDTFSILGGKEALYKLNDMLEQNRIVLDRKVFNPTVMAYKNYSIGEEFLNGMTSILNRRMALNGYFINHGFRNSILETDIALWKHAKEVVLYKCNIGNVILSKDDIEFERIIDMEEKLFRSIKV